MKAKITWSHLAKFLCGECTPEEEKEVKQWTSENEQNATVLNESENLWANVKSLKTKEEKSSINAESSIAKMLARIEAEEKAAQSPRVVALEKETPAQTKVFSISLLYRIAAVLLLTLGISALWYFLNKNNSEETLAEVNMLKISTEKGKRKEVVLPDGTKVTLNVASTLEYPENFNGKTRNVTLSGEAKFEVAKNADKPFIITAGNTETKVLGTIFNLKAYPEDKKVEVAVSEGKVRFAQKDKDDSQAVILTHHEFGVLEEGANAPTEITLDDNEMPKWQDGKLIFRKHSMIEVVAVLERWYNVKIFFKRADIGKRTLTGEFEAKKIGEVMESISIALDLEYQSEGDSIFIIN